MTDRYPYTYTEAWNRVKAALPSAKMTDFNKFIARHKIKTDPNYATYHYPSQKSEQKDPTRTTAVLYNENFVKFCISSLAT